MADDETCAVCGEPAERRHHLTGRGADHGYLDRELTVSVCHDDHELIHDDLRHDRIDKPLAGLCVFEQVARRLERVAVFIARLAEQPAPVWLAGLAEFLRRWAAELLLEIARLDTNNPSWRTIP